MPQFFVAAKVISSFLLPHILKLADNAKEFNAESPSRFHEEKVSTQPVFLPSRSSSIHQTSNARPSLRAKIGQMVIVTFMGDSLEKSSRWRTAGTGRQAGRSRHQERQAGGQPRRKGLCRGKEMFANIAAMSATISVKSQATQTC